MARTVKPADTKQTAPEGEESLVQIFFRGFFWPLKLIGKGLAWLGHRPPLKQIGHAIRWFFRLRAIRFMGRVLGLTYLRSSWQELRQVTWPSRREGLRLTSAVIVFSIIFGALIAVVDYGLDKLFRQLLVK
ncbi:MAG TPA: preprotein translocase subunit SecE [Candidatus Saccharimonadales bacterium]|nr:preprotein translocase subunit SecE [Candidatus Saccharimonadales bacterium]